MAPKLIFLPVCVQILLTVYAYLRLKSVKVRAIKSGEVDHSRRSVHGDAWPDSVVVVNNNITNQLQVPVLFYVAVLSLWSLNAVDLAAHLVAWLFVISRIAHAVVHLGKNHVPTRLKLFTVGIAMVVVLVGLIVRAVVVS